MAPGTRLGSHSSSNASVSSISSTGASASGGGGDRGSKPSAQSQTRGPPPRPERSHARIQSEASTGTAVSSASSSSVSAIQDTTATTAVGPGPTPAGVPSAGDKATRRITINPLQTAGTRQAPATPSHQAPILRHGATPSTAPSAYHPPPAHTTAPGGPVPMARAASHNSQLSTSSSVSIGGISATVSSVSVPSNKAVHSPSVNASRPRPVSTIVPSGPSSAAAYAQEMKEKRMSQLMTTNTSLAELSLDGLDGRRDRPFPPRIRTCGPDPPNDKYIAPRPAPAPPANVLSHRQSLFVSAALGSSSSSSSGGTSPVSDDGGSGSKTQHSPPLTGSTSGNPSTPTSERKQLRMRHSASMLVNRLLPMNSGSRSSILGNKVSKVSPRV